MSLLKSLSRSPGRMLLLSVIGTILSGTFLLSLSLAQITSHSFIDLLFTSASATCGTGLLTVKVAGFTLFGKAVILALIQIGGLGLITMTVFIISLFFKVGMRTHLMAGHILELTSWKNSKKIIVFVIGFTFFIETVGAIFLRYSIPEDYLMTGPWFAAFFQSVSSFCNTGISVLSKDITGLSTNVPFLATTAMLALIGGLGFITWHELSRYVGSLRKKQLFKLSLHSRLVISFTLFIVIFGSLGLLVLGTNAYSTDHSILHSISNAVFNAICSRSCGFTTIDVSRLVYPMFFLIMLITFIGSAPISTGGGIKVISLALIVATVRSVISGRSSVEAGGRRIPNDQILKVVAVVVLAISWIFITTLLLLIFEGGTFFRLIFEAFAAFANQGISLNVTPTLSTISKYILVSSMIVGKIGALTLVLAIKKQKDTVEFQYPEERVMLG